jgi:hypothetical protein
MLLSFVIQLKVLAGKDEFEIEKGNWSVVGLDALFVEVMSSALQYIVVELC